MLGWEGMRLRLMVKAGMKNPRVADKSSEDDHTTSRITKALEELSIQNAAKARKVEIARIVRNDLPNLATARKATEQALDVLGPSAR